MLKFECFCCPLNKPRMMLKSVPHLLPKFNNEYITLGWRREMWMTRVGEKLVHCIQIDMNFSVGFLRNYLLERKTLLN